VPPLLKPAWAPQPYDGSAANGEHDTLGLLVPTRRWEEQLLSAAAPLLRV